MSVILIGRSLKMLIFAGVGISVVIITVFTIDESVS